VATQVLLLRHTQSTWNASGRWQGWSDAPLSAEGELAARAAASDPALDGIGAAVASDLARARRTAELIAEQRHWPPIGVYRGLRERGAGRWTGLTRAEIELAWPGALETSPPVIPGGESPAALIARAIATLHRIAEDHPASEVLAVSHGALIRAVELYAGAEAVRVPNLGGRWVEVSAGRLVLGATVGLVPAAGTTVGLAPAAGAIMGPAGDEAMVARPGEEVTMIVGLDHVQLAMPAGGEDAAEAFYAGVLGIPRVPKPAPLAARGGCWFEQGPLRVHLGVEGDFRPARKAHPALAVLGLAELVERLRRSGQVVSGGEGLDGLDQAYVDDPFGNRIELIERLGAANASASGFRGDGAGPVPGHPPASS